MCPAPVQTGGQSGGPRLVSVLWDWDSGPADGTPVSMGTSRGCSIFSWTWVLSMRCFKKVNG